QPGNTAACELEIGNDPVCVSRSRGRSKDSSQFFTKIAYALYSHRLLSPITNELQNPLIFRSTTMKKILSLVFVALFAVSFCATSAFSADPNRQEVAQRF